MLTAAETQRRRHDALSLCVALRRHKIRCVCSFRAAWRGGIQVVVGEVKCVTLEVTTRSLTP